MDPSAWMEYTAAQQAYSQLRVPGNSQLNPGSHSHQYNPNRNLHQLNHMAAFNNVASCQKSANQAKSPKQASQLSTNMNMNHNTGQSLMNGHYNASANGSSWFFNSRQQHSAHDNSLQVRNHPERGNPSFNPNPFGIHTPNGVYDSSFMSTPFQQQSKSNYLPSMAAASGFMNNMKKPETEMNFRNTSYCPSMKSINMAHCSNTLRDSNLTTGSFFNSHLNPATASAWHHQNLLSSNTTNNGMLPHETVNMMASHNSSSTLPRPCNRSTSNPTTNSLNGFCQKVACNAPKASQPSNHLNSSHSHNQYKNPTTAAPFTNMPLSSNNSYLMQNFPSNRSGQNSFVDSALGAKFAAAAAHHHVASDHYASLAFAAAMNSEYASFQQQAQKHQQYMSSMNNFTSNASGHSADYPAMPFDSTSFNTQRHSNGLMNYCSASLFPIASDTSVNPNFKSHNTLLDDFSCSNQVSNSSTNVQASKATRKNVSSQKKQQNYKPETISPNMNGAFNEFMSTANCNNFVNAASNNCLANNGSSNITSNSVSRCSSVASNHQMQHSNDSYSYNYSPATTNISAHSPYQQRSSTSNSSHSSGASCAMSNGEYLNYGTPNSVPTTVFPTMGSSQTPTPTPGYPTPPSSVGHSNSRCNSNEELSPYSNNSMSSSISQPYSRNDYKSSSSSSSQISPKQIDNSISESLSFNSCMVASQKGNISSDNMNQQKHLLNSTSIFDSNPLDDSYKSQQFSVSYQSHLSSSAPSSTCSNDLYMNYGSDNSSIQMNNPDSLVTMPNGNNSNGIDNSSYDYHYEQSENDEFNQSYSDKSELPSCARQISKPPTHPSNSHLIDSIEEPKADYQSSHESFNLNFDSVIQPIDVNLSDQQEQIQELAESTDSSINLNRMNIAGDKSTFPSIDDLNFIASQSQVDNHCSLNDKHVNYTISQPMGNSDQANSTIEQIEYQSSHDETHLIEDSSAMECNNIQSIIDSLPKSSDECLQSNKSDHNELLSHCIVADSFLSDLAPLMNDNSKIALMESTFKSNDISTIDHDKDLDISSTPFEKLNKDIFDQHNDLKLHSSIDFDKHDHEENQLEDVDEFLETNLKDVQASDDLLNHNGLDTTLQNVSSPPKDSKVICPNVPSIKLSLKLSTIAKTPSKKSDKKNIVKDNCEAANKSGQSKFFKRKSNDDSLNDNNCNKKRKVAVVMPKSKECKKPNNEYDFFESATKPKRSSKKSPSTEKPRPSKRSSKVQSPKAETIISNNEVTLNSSIKNTTSQGKKTVAEIAPSKVTKTKDNSIDNLTTNLKMESLTMDTSPNSLSDAKENVASINTSSAKKSKGNHSNVTNKANNSGKALIDKSACITVNNKKNEKLKSLNNKSCKTKSASAKSLPKSLISPKTCSMVSPTSNSLLPQASLINATCINKPVSSNFNLTPSTNATLNNVTPTLIVNQNPPVNSYQVSPMTNAVLISIHPANTASISSLTAPSFITLSTQSSTSNTTTTTSSTQNPSSRRRSQDKKVATIKEGLMRTGDFVVADEEAHLDLPVIWRIEGKSLLQRFEPSEQNGITVYTNTSSYSAWNPTVRQKYLGLDVRIMGCNRTRIVVEKLGLTQTKPIESTIISQVEKDQSSTTVESLSPRPTDISHYIENFEVFIQTLVSQALDPNFIAEIVKENDDYFLTHIQTIDELCNKKRSSFASKVKWDLNILKCIETYREIQIHQQNNVGDLRCRLCHDNWSTKILNFEGNLYSIDTLEPISQVDAKQTKLASCDSCTEKTFLYSKLHHQKYNCFLACKSKVEAILSQDENKESHVILEECLQDSDWIKKLFSELESILISCDNIR